ncbi:unnamed protein product, partial [Dovyalis caffra]
PGTKHHWVSSRKVVQNIAEDKEAYDCGGFLQERPGITCERHPPGFFCATCVLRSPLPGFPPYLHVSGGPTLMVCFQPLNRPRVGRFKPTFYLVTAAKGYSLVKNWKASNSTIN